MVTKFVSGQNCSYLCTRQIGSWKGNVGAQTEYCGATSTGSHKKVLPLTLENQPMIYHNSRFRLLGKYYRYMSLIGSYTLRRIAHSLVRRHWLELSQTHFPLTLMLLQDRKKLI